MKGRASALSVAASNRPDVPSLALLSREGRPQFATGPLSLAIAQAVVLIFSPNTALAVAMTACLAVTALVLGQDALISLMFVTTFLVAHTKIAYGGWQAYLIQDLLAAIIIALWAAGRITTGRSLFGGTPVSRPFVVLLGYLILELLNPLAPIARTVFGLRSWVMYTVMLFVGYASYRSAAQLARFYRILILVGIGTAVFGIWQWQQGAAGLIVFGERYFRYASRLNWLPMDGSPGVFRAFSTFATSTAFAANMALIITFAACMVLSHSVSKIWKIVCTVGIVLMGAGIAVSGSRAGPAYLLASLAVMLVLLRRFRILIPLVVGGLFSLELIQSVSGSLLAERFATLLDPETFLWKWGRPFQGAFAAMRQYPLGHGLAYTTGLPQFVAPGGFVDNLRTGAVVDSGYGAVIAEVGVPGLVLYCWLSVQLAVSAFDAWRRLAKEERDLFLAPAAYAISLPIMSGLTPPQAFLPSASYTWLFMGMLLAAGAAQRSVSGRAGVVALPRAPRDSPRMLTHPHRTSR